MLVLIAGLLNAIPTCPAYTYHDFVWESVYSYPVRPPDTLLERCSSTGVDPAICSQMNNPNLTADAKRQLVLDGLQNKSGFPDFATAASWNGNLTFTKYAPDGVQRISSANIRDAWNRIMAIEPSLYSKNSTLLINSTGQVVSRNGFTFVVKHETFPGDCSTVYRICGYNKQVSDTFGSPSTSQLSINTEYQIDHYQLVTHCFSTGDSEFCFTTCDYISTEDRRDSLTLADQVQTKADNPQFQAFSFIESSQNGLVDGWLVFNSSDEFNKAIFSIGNSTIAFRQSSYKLSSNFSPYNAITPKANLSPNDFDYYGIAIISRETNDSNASRYEKIHFLAPAKALNCTFDFYGHFTRALEAEFCYLDNQTPAINLSIANLTNSTVTIALRFYDNQSDAALVSKNISLMHGNQTLFVVTDQQGEATATFNFTSNSPIITAYFQTDFITKSARAQLAIPTVFPFTLSDVWYIAALLIALFLLFIFAKKEVQNENH